MRHIIYVDGSVGVGKSTFIQVLSETFKSTLKIKNGNCKNSHCFKIDVLPEPLHRDWTKRIVDGIGYENLLKFLLVRKMVAIENWSNKIAMDGMQELENNVLIVERSLEGDRLVNAGFGDMFNEIKVKHRGEKVFNVFVKNLDSGSDEQARLNMLYSDIATRDKNSPNNVHVLIRPRRISEYHIEAADIVQKVLNV